MTMQWSRRVVRMIASRLWDRSVACNAWRYRSPAFGCTGLANAPAGRAGAALAVKAALAALQNRSLPRTLAGRNAPSGRRPAEWSAGLGSGETGSDFTAQALGCTESSDGDH
jgi:hypothetical protein